MGWDASRPVPWQRLVREWFIYVGIMAAVFLLFMRDRPLVGIFGGLLASGPLYLLLGFVLAKFGYQRKTMKQLRADGAGRGAGRSSAPASTSDAPRPRPAPTKRTGAVGPGRPGGRKRRR